jgi:hypothetical protein
MGRRCVRRRVASRTCEGGGDEGHHDRQLQVERRSLERGGKPALTSPTVQPSSHGTPADPSEARSSASFLKEHVSRRFGGRVAGPDRGPRTEVGQRAGRTGERRQDHNFDRRLSGARLKQGDEGEYRESGGSVIENHVLAQGVGRVLEHLSSGDRRDAGDEHEDID